MSVCENQDMLEIRYFQTGGGTTAQSQGHICFNSSVLFCYSESCWQKVKVPISNKAKVYVRMEDL